jgi:hypothetical protein
MYLTLDAAGGDPSRRELEAWALEEYRNNRVTKRRCGDCLGLVRVTSLTAS